MRYIDRYDAVQKLQARGLSYDAANSATRKMNWTRSWIDATINPRIDHYHTAYSLTSHLQGRSKGTLYGLELEVEYRDSSQVNDEVAKQVYSIAENTIGKGIIRIESDGSLRNGIEIITAPLSEKEWRVSYSKWFKFLTGLKTLGFKSHNTSTCGLHFHITKPPENAVAKIETLILGKPESKSFWSDLSRRNGSFGYCAFKRQDTRRNNKYFAINKLPSNTLELRLYKGTLLPHSLFGALESVFALTNYATDNTVQRISWNRFITYVKTSKRYNNLVSYVEANMGGNWYPLPIKPRVKRTPEVIAEENRLREEKRVQREREAFERLMNERTSYLCSMYEIARSVYPTANEEGYYRTRAIEVRVVDGSQSQDRELRTVVTPLVFRPMLPLGSTRPVIAIRRTNGYGHRNNYANLTYVANYPAEF